MTEVQNHIQLGSRARMLVGVSVILCHFAAAIPTTHACPPASQAEAAAEGTYRIGAGDVLSIVVWRNAELSIEVPVRPDGWISMPLVNDVEAAGKTPMELQRHLSQRLSEFVSSSVITVIVAQARSSYVTVLGKVNSQGRYALNGSMTVLDLLGMAGGLDEFASDRGIFVLRNDPGRNVYRRIPFDYSASLSAGGKSANLVLKAGDFVIVP